MNLIYYRNADGDVYRYHRADALTPDELNIYVEQYNALYPIMHNGDTAHVAVLDKGSLLWYLYNECETRRYCAASSVNDALYAIDEARLAVDALRTEFNEAVSPGAPLELLQDQEAPTDAAAAS